MKVVVVGPTHPFKGGVAAHTTSLSRELRSAGHEVRLESWSALYPKRLYPGDLRVAPGEPDVEEFDPVTRRLSWARPHSWWAAGRRARHDDVLILVCVVPAQVPALLAVARAARTARGGVLGSRRPPKVVALVHNVAPHESHPGARALITRLVRSADAVIVHSPEQGDQARALGARSVSAVPLPPHLSGGIPGPLARAAAVAARIARRSTAEPVRVLALGLVRDYKGFDLLVRAAAQVPSVVVTVAGEAWGAAGDAVRSAAGEPALRDRVLISPGYVPASAIGPLLAAHDVLALPYRSATGSQNVALAHAHGLPVVASAIAPFSDQLRDGVDGLLFPPGDVERLAEVLARLDEPGVLEGLVRAVPGLDEDAAWAEYLAALFTAAGLEPAPEVPVVGESAPAHRRPAEPKAAEPKAAEPKAAEPKAAGVLRMLARVLRAPAVRWGVGLLAVGLAGWALAGNWAEVVAATRRMNPWWLLAALAASVANIAAATLVWWRLLLDAGTRLAAGPTAKVFLVGQLGKYVPGSLWPVVVQAELARDHGVPSRRTAGASMVSLLIGVLTALGWFLASLAVLPAGLPSWVAWSGLLAVPLLALLHPRILGPLLALATRVTGGQAPETRPSLRGIVIAGCWSAISWGFAGVQVWAITAALGAPVTARTLLLCTGGYCLAWITGFVVILAPAGAGAREAALALVLSALVGSGAVLVAVLMSRVLFTLCDLVLAGLGFALGHPARPAVDQPVVQPVVQPADQSPRAGAHET